MWFKNWIQLVWGVGGGEEEGKGGGELMHPVSSL